MNKDRSCGDTICSVCWTSPGRLMGVPYYRTLPCRSGRVAINSCSLRAPPMDAPVRPFGRHESGGSWLTYKYSAAISYLSRDESLALAIRDALQNRLQLPVFVYPDRQTDLAGKGLDEALSPVFEQQSGVVVVLYRPAWGKTGGTLVEYRAVTRRRNRSNENFLFPVVVEHGDGSPPWAEDIVYWDLARYGLPDAVNGIARMVAEQQHAQPSPPDSVLTEPVPTTQTASLLQAMRRVLRKDFVSTPGPFHGYFGAKDAVEDSKRWQSNGGESTDAPAVPKRPYYQTYWGYEAALRIDADSVGVWAPHTLAAIANHFAGNRWLEVVREYAFSSGPRKTPQLAESVRHTARAAELTYLLAPKDRRVSEVAWDLITEATSLQHSNGGWCEFRNGDNPPALWATVYVHRLLSKLRLAERGSGPDEREAFAVQATPLLTSSELFLAKLWHKDRWQIEDTISWDEGTAAVLAEVGYFLFDDALVLDAYNGLRSTVNPAGRLVHPEGVAGRPPEAILGLRTAFGLRSCGRGLAEGDARYHRLVAWLREALVPTTLTVYDIAFAAAVLDLGTKHEDYARDAKPAEQGDAADGASRRN